MLDFFEYKCDVPECKFKSIYFQNLIRHNLVHTKEKKFPCLICKYATTNAANLDKHMRKHDGKKPFECTFPGCGQKFSVKCTLTIHMRRHLGEKPYLCTYEGCDKAFVSANSLKDHMCYHTGERRFKCDFEGCNLAFFASGHLKDHFRTHTGEKPYACPYEDCDMIFSRQNSLTSHIRTHTGEKPYKCKFEGCTYESAMISSMICHKRIHTGETPYSCGIEGCTYSFSRSDYLKIHQYYYHDPEGIRVRHRQEHSIQKLFEANNINFSREYPVSFSCIGRTRASIDFLLIINGVMIFIEVDENQHCDYGVDCDLKRMADIYSVLTLGCITMPIIFIRYNPHAYKVDGKTKKTTQIERHSKLLETIEYASKLEQNAILYLFYDIDKENKPMIFQDEEYDEMMKELVIIR